MNVETVSIPLSADYKVTATELRAEIERRRALGLAPLKGLIQSTPANPTGAMLSSKEVKQLCRLCEEEGIWYVSDEIYHGISFGTKDEVSALRFDRSLSRRRNFSFRRPRPLRWQRRHQRQRNGLLRANKKKRAANKNKDGHQKCLEDEGA